MKRCWNCQPGRLKVGEPPEITAGRELIEETGYHAAKIELVHEFYSCLASAMS